MRALLPTRRDLRLATGLTLLGYIATHLLTHAVGLVSLQAAERALSVSVAVWHSLPGTLLLYGAAALHVALALHALYQRRTLRMPALELLRIWMGLAIPLLLIGHVVLTRTAWELYEAAPRYARVAWSLWLSDGEGMQLAMLVPGWLHGCLGVHFAFGRRATYARLHRPLFALALLVPVLGALGFLAMGKELAAAAALQSLPGDAQPLPAHTRMALLALRDQALAVYFGAIGAVFAARALRALAERHRAALVRIDYPQGSVRVPRGWSVLEASRAHRLPHASMCGGRARCTTCRVRVESGAAHCLPPQAAELAALERIGAPPDVRLACQLRPRGDVAVVPLIAPPRDVDPADGAGAAEHELALVAAQWCNEAEFARAHLPQDLVFAAQSFADTAAGALRAAGATVVEVRAARVLGLFGLEGGPLATHARAALAAAAQVEAALAPVAQRHAAAFGTDMALRVCAHAGHVTVGTLAGGAQFVVAGEAMTALEAQLAVGRPGPGASAALLAAADRAPVVSVR